MQGSPVCCGNWGSIDLDFPGHTGELLDMRKITMLISVAGLALTVAGCSKSEDAAPTEAAATTEAAAESSEAAPAASGAADDAAAAATGEGDDRGNPGDRG
jgi:hypothetical protein